MSKFKTACRNCSKTFSAPMAAEGKALRCPACNKKFVVRPIPAANSAAKSTAPPTAPTIAQPSHSASQGAEQRTASAASAGSSRKSRPGRPRAGESKKQKFERSKALLQSSFKADKIRRKSVSVFYLFGMGIGAFAMILLPIIYLTLIAATGYGVFWHTINNTYMLTTFGGGFYGMVLKFLAYLAPIFGCVILILILFIIKPILARPVYKYHRRYISRQSEPIVFWLIDRVCEALQSPVPNRFMSIVMLTHRQATAPGSLVSWSVQTLH